MRRYRTLRTLAILLLTTVLYACGTRGPLFLPPAQNKPANTSNAAPVSPSDMATTTNVPTTAADLNTPRKPAQ